MRILIVKTSALGDIIQTFPVLSYLRQKFPKATIDWLVEGSCSDVLEAHPFINKVLKVELKQWRKSPFKITTWLRVIRTLFSVLKKYDVIFDLQGNLKSGILLFFLRAKIKIGFGFKTISEIGNFLFTDKGFNPPSGKNIREDYLFVVQSFFNDLRDFQDQPIDLKIEAETHKELDRLFASKPTLVCPGAHWKNKRLERYSLIDILKRLNQGPYFFIWGDVEEKEEVEKIAAEFSDAKVLDKMPLPVLQQAMKRSRLVVAMDSLPLHLCGTTSTPTWSFFGPSLATKYAPRGEHHSYIQGACPYNVQFEKRCPKLRTCMTGACRHIKLDRVGKDRESVL